MKIVHFSDLHLDASFAWLGARSDVARARRDAQRRTLETIARLAQEERADALFSGGDLFEHDLVTPDTVSFLLGLFDRLAPLPVFLAPGNHDWLSPRSPYVTADWPENVHIFRSDRLEPVVLQEGLTLWGAAHLAPANTDSFLEGFQVGRGGINLALFHGADMEALPYESSGKAPHAPFHAPQIAAAGLHHAFLGHYHRPRDREMYTYPGNPEPLEFGEEGIRGALIATIHPDGQITRERRRVAETEVGDLEVDLTPCASRHEVLELVRTELSGRRGFIRLTLVGELQESVDLRPSDVSGVELPPGVLGIQVREHLRSTYDLPSIAAEPTVRGEFVRRVQGAHLPPDEERRVLLTGLRALGGRSDLEIL